RLLTPSLDLLASLVDHGLIQRVDHDEDEPRYQMLETIREFGEERLTAGEEAETRRRHAAWCVALAEEAAPRLGGPDQARWLDRIATEAGNIRAAQDWALAKGQWELGLRLALALYTFWLIRRSSHDDSVWLERLLAITPESLVGDPAVRRARALHLLGVLRHAASDYVTARSWYEASLVRRRALGDRRGQEATLHNLALLAMTYGDPVRASALSAEAISICRELGDRTHLAHCLGNYADALIALGHRGRAQAALQEATELLRDRPTPREHAHRLLRLGDAAWSGRGDAEAARPLYEEALERFRQIGDERLVSAVLAHLSHLAFAADDHIRAARCVVEALALDSAGDDRGQVANFLDRQAAIAVASGYPEHAARLHGAADAPRGELGIVPLPVLETERGRTLVAVQAALGEPRVATLQAEGRGLSFHAVIAEAIAVVDLLAESVQSSTESVTDVVLTYRERDVLRLLVEGRSDKAIGEALGLGHRTIATHVSNMLAKFGVPTRAAVVAHALRHGLVDGPDDGDTSFDGTAANA
ncbi:MAG: LuxR C-terminal-related transcriptional regulator, partial [Thermomicrobiales bacterium]